MKRLITTLLILVVAGAGAPASAVWDLKSDSWVATDALGRKLPGYAECGPKRSGKFVGIFYFLWLGQHGTGGPYDNTKILAANPTNPAWGPESAFHHWGESELGYYLSDDAYVIRKHCWMLANAGIDTLIFDVTNGFSYTSNYMLVLSILQQIRDSGGITPQVCFLVNPFNNGLVQQLYNELYSQNLYPDLWFRWQGKPLMLTTADGLSPELQSYFTFRQTWAWSNSWWWGTGQDKWTWLDTYPQNAGWHTSQSIPEEASVCVAQHPTTNIGRSFHNGAEPSPDQVRSAEGLFFAEQWSRFVEPPADPESELNPDFVFITGWNEWTAMRFLSDGDDTFLGRQLALGETFFVDTYNQEYSRDVEPMKGGHTDNYYYQMIAGIRRYKGMQAPDPIGAPKTIAVDGAFADWSDVTPEYRDVIGDTLQRNSIGWGSAGTYTNTTGRNDIKLAKVARDSSNVYFYVETASAMTSSASPNWMLLFIDSDCNKSTGWQGYDYLVNYPPLSLAQTTLKRSTGGWNWTPVSDVSFRLVGNAMEIGIPRADIGQSGSRVALDFHWADNIQNTDDITEFSVSGDSAPDRRFDYHYDTGTCVVSVFAGVPDGYYAQGKLVSLRVKFADNIRLTGSPRLLLETGSTDRYAYCTGSNGTDTLEFTYAIQTGDSSADLDYVSTAALDLDGGSIVDWYGTPAAIDLPAPGAPGSLSASSGIVADGIRPTVTGVTSSTPNGIYAPGEQVSIQVTFSEPVVVTGVPELKLRLAVPNRTARYASGSGGGTHSFSYTVQPNDASSDLDYETVSSLLAVSATLKDLAGNHALRTLASPGAPGSLGAAKAITIIPGDGSIAAARTTAEGLPVALANKNLYYASDGFGYIEEPSRSSGIRVEGALGVAEGSRLHLVGTAGHTTAGERCILVHEATAKGAASVAPLGASNRFLRAALMEGLFVRAWGVVLPGSIAGNAYTISDGSDPTGIRVFSRGAVQVSEGVFTTVTGAAGFDGARVIFGR